MKIVKIVLTVTLLCVVMFLGSCAVYCSKQRTHGYEAAVSGGSAKENINDAFKLGVGFFLLTCFFGCLTLGIYANKK